MVSERVRRNAPIIVALSNANVHLQKLTINQAKKDLIMALVECAKNIILGNVKLTNSQYNALRQHRTDINKLVLSKTLINERKIILQKGGFLPLLIKPLLSLFGGLLGGGR